MKLIYFTNIWSHHHEGVCRALHELLKDDFKMFLYQPFDNKWSLDRLKMGWNIYPPQENWIVPPPVDEKSRKAFVAQMLDADVAVGGVNESFPMEFHRQWVIKERKLWFAMGERFFKQPVTLRRLLTTRLLKQIYDIRQLLGYSNVHYLTMNHYCGKDLHFMHLCKDRIWTWGYLPQVPETSPRQRESKRLQLLWCGRMWTCKQVDSVLLAAKKLFDSGRRDFNLRLIGEGYCREDLIRLTAELGLNDHVEFLPMTTPESAREEMRKAHVYCFSSNRIEGWGVTLLEAMSEGCAVVADDAAGATLDLVRDRENGFVYRDGDIDGLFQALAEIYDLPDRGEAIGRAAWQTMQSWSPAVGAERLCRLTEAVFAKRELPVFESGLCSRK